MQVNKQYNYSNNNSKMKAKRVGKKNANTRQHADVLLKRKPKNSAKNHSASLQAVNRSTRE